MSIDPKKFGLSDSLVNAVNEALKGDQHKIDVNKNGKIDAQDFKKLRGEQSPGDYEKANYKHDMMAHDKKMKNEVADGNKSNFKQNMKEGAEQIDEKVKTTHENPLVTVHDKDGLHTHANLSTANKIFNTKVKHTDVHAGPVKTKDGHETKNNLTFAISKHHASAMKEETVAEATKLVAKPQYDKARPAFGGTNVAADMDARKKEVQRKIAAKQASMQMAKSNKRISGSTVKEAKCSCGEEKGSKMTCEVHGDNKGLKGGKEPIVMNPPLKEASNLPKAVVSKGHEIAKSLIKHRSKVKEPYAVGMATAKKSAGIKD